MAAPLAPLGTRDGVMAGPSGFGWDWLSTMGQRGGAAEGWFVPPQPPRPGRLDGGLFIASSEIFGILFTPHPQYTISPGLPGGPATKAGIQHSVETYELTASVIHNELAPRGEQLSVTA